MSTEKGDQVEKTDILDKAKDLEHSKIENTPKKKKGFPFFLVVVSLMSFIFFLFILFGFFLTDIKYASFYYNSLRVQEEKKLGTQQYRCINAEVSTMYGENERRYFNAMQPIKSENGGVMAGSPYSAPYADAFPMDQSLQFRIFNCNDQILLEKQFLEQVRFPFLCGFDDSIYMSELVDYKVDKLQPLRAIDNNATVRQIINNLPLWAQSLVELMESISNEFKEMYKTQNFNNNFDQKYFIEFKDGKASFSNQFSAKLKEIIDRLPSKKLMNNGERDIEESDVIAWFTRYGYANPTVKDSFIMERLAYLFYFINSDKKSESFDLSELKKLLDAKKTLLAEINRENPNMSEADKNKKTAKLDKNINSLRTKFIIRSCSLIFSNLYKVADQKSNYPFNSAADKRSFFFKLLSIKFSDQSTKESNQILSGLYEEPIGNNQ